ncbi:MAG TPA: IS1182 family transposase, partial [Ktedonobacter sp.]|nr:IS1182 family transposase [Ktedonobacter sp.]
MSLQPQAIPSIPEETARIAHAILPKGNIFIHMRDELGAFFRDEDFLDLFSEKGQPAESAWRLALVMVMQYAEGLTDRQAADAVRTRIDWKYALSLEITDPGFDFSVLSEFRSRLIAHGAERRFFDLILSQFRERGWVKERGKQRTDSAHILAAIRAVNRLECVGETMRHALNILAEVAPEWLVEHMKPEWAKRYRSRFSDFRLPKSEKSRLELAEEIGADGRDLLEKVYTSPSHSWLRELPAIQIVRCIWIQQYHAREQGTPWRNDQELPPSALLFSSPYDIEARYSKKKQTGWVGYKVHFTEGCDSDQPHFLVEVTTTAATIPDGDVMEDLHERLAEKQVVPRQHLVDKGYVDAEMLANSQQIHQIDIVGPALPDTSWASKEAGRFDQSQFSIDWEAKSVLCPAGHTSRDWGHIPDRHGKPSLRIRFPLPLCRSCPLHAQCTPVAAKVLILRPNQQSFEALQNARQPQETPEFRVLYAKRAGIEVTVAQAVRTCEIRRSLYIGLKKLNLQAFLT